MSVENKVLERETFALLHENNAQHFPFHIATHIILLAYRMHWQSIAAVATPLLLAAHGLQTKKLTRGGACMSVAVGWLLLAAGLKYFVTLIAFYFIGSAATKFRSAAKMVLVSEGGGPGKAHVYGRRGAQQVAIKGDAFFLACGALRF
jgi:uncharacterized membrane protein